MQGDDSAYRLIPLIPDAFQTKYVFHVHRLDLCSIFRAREPIYPIPCERS